MSNYNMHSFKSKPTNKSVMSPIKFIFLASLVLNTSGNTLIGLNCSFPNTMDPPAGFKFVLKSCPSQVHFDARYLCRIPDLMRCDLPCPGQCPENKSTVEYCIISWTCHWKLTNDDAISNSTTMPPIPPQTETGISTLTIVIITTFTLIVFVVIAVVIWYFVFKPRYGRLREEENFNVTYQHRESEKISFNFFKK